MSEHAPDRLWAGIDIPKTIAGVLAAVSAAVVGSFLGVAGTLAGAAVASIVGSVGTEIYHRSIERGKQRLQSTFVTAAAAVGTPPVVAAESESPSEAEPPAAVPVTRPAAKKLRWGRVAMFAGALFVLALGALSAFELTAGKSVADAVGSKSSSTSTIGSVLDRKDSKKDTPVTTPSRSATPAPTGSSGDGGDASTEPGTDPSGAPSSQPSVEPSSDAVTSVPTEAPTTSPDSPGTTTPPAGDTTTGDTGDQGTQQDDAGTGTGGGGAGSAEPLPVPDSSGK